MFNKEKALQDMKINLSEKRYNHCFRVAETAIELAKIHGEDEEKAYLAGLLHDFAKYMSNEASLKELKKSGNFDEFFIDEANLAHGEIAAYILENEYGLDDKEILSAIAKHTFGATDMTKLDMIVYLADATEPKRDYPSCNKIRELSKKNLEMACLEYLKNNFKYLVEIDKRIYTKSVDMYNLLLERSKDGF